MKNDNDKTLAAAQPQPANVEVTHETLQLAKRIASHYPCEDTCYDGRIYQDAIYIQQALTAAVEQATRELRDALQEMIKRKNPFLSTPTDDWREFTDATNCDPSKEAVEAAAFIYNGNDQIRAHITAVTIQQVSDWHKYKAARAVLVAAEAKLAHLEKEKA